jgi:hypothetical protein
VSQRLCTAVDCTVSRGAVTSRRDHGGHRRVTEAVSPDRALRLGTTTKVIRRYELRTAGLGLGASQPRIERTVL